MAAPSFRTVIAPAVRRPAELELVALLGGGELAGLALDVLAQLALELPLVAPGLHARHACPPPRPTPVSTAPVGVRCAAGLTDGRDAGQLDQRAEEHLCAAAPRRAVSRHATPRHATPHHHTGAEQGKGGGKQRCRTVQHAHWQRPQVVFAVRALEQRGAVAPLARAVGVQ
jgi:hypothetical protein